MQHCVCDIMYDIISSGINTNQRLTILCIQSREFIYISKGRVEYGH